MTLPAAVTLVEVGPRDGLQNEATVLSAADKVELVRRLLAGGARRIEVASFVNPARVPQMADAEEVLAGLGPSPEGASFIGLVLNRRGLDRALATAVDEVNFVVGASEGFNRANAGATVDETMAEIEAMLPQARDAGRFTTVTISVAFGCPFDGEVPVEAVARLAARSAAAGAEEVALGDTIGVAAPGDVVDRLAALGDAAAGATLRCHFHDTRNTGVANVYAALTAGVTVIDASVGGAGGCPFAPNATGNIPTEDLAYLLDRAGIDTGLDLDALTAVVPWIEERLGKRVPGLLSKAGRFPRPA